MPKLKSAKRECFCQEYIKDNNATAAAKRAKYSEHTATEQGSFLLTIPEVQQRIAELRAVREERTRVTQDRVIKELALIGFSDLRNYINIDPATGTIVAKGFEEMSGEESRALKAIKEDRAIKEDAKGEQVTVYDKVSFTLHDKIAALKILAQHLGMLIERHEVTGEDGGPVQIQYVLVKDKPKTPEEEPAAAEEKT